MEHNQDPPLTSKAGLAMKRKDVVAQKYNKTRDGSMESTQHIILSPTTIIKVKSAAQNYGTKTDSQSCWLSRVEGETAPSELLAIILENRLYKHNGMFFATTKRPILSSTTSTSKRWREDPRENVVVNSLKRAKRSEARKMKLQACVQFYKRMLRDT